MKLWDLKNKIIQKDIPNLLIFTGEERVLMQMYIEEIEKALGKSKINVPSVADAYNESLTKSLLDTGKKLMLVRDDAKFKGEDGAPMWPRIANINATLIITYTGIIDKRSKFNKQFEESIIVFDRLKPEMIVDALSTQIAVKKDYLNWLVSSCSNDYSRCLNEIDKLKIFADVTDKDALFYKFAKEGAFHPDIPDCVFDFTNAVMKRDVKLSFDIFIDLKRRGDSPIQILGLLYNNFRNMTSVQMCDKPNAESTGLEDRQINAIKWNKNKYTNAELLDAVALIAELDRMIKIGTIDESLALEYFIVRTL